METSLFNWEGRPAAIVDGKGWFVPRSNKGWASASRVEIIDSGEPISDAAFRVAFPGAADLPNSPLMIGDQAGSAEGSAAA